MNMIGTTELMLILGIAVLLFGAAKIPELAKAVGGAVNEFKKAQKGLEDDIET